ncbi:MAG TPA: glucose-6-phosphate isomerase [Alphaproteobacteria bacterium]|nr:glucose-6-phosphate isomerase [Alphaproteobacteria bacterium]
MQLTRRNIWPELARLTQADARTPLDEMFNAEPGRESRFQAGAGAITLDYSRERISAKALATLLKLAEEADIQAARQKLFEGRVVNPSENRPALHPALRRFSPAPLMLNGQDVMPAIRQERERALALAEKLRGGKAIRHIVHVGIGGSELGPRLLVDAFADGKGPEIHFIASPDGAALQKLMARLKPEETFVLLVSKSFSTAEVQRNGKTLLAWLEKALGGKAKKHLLAATSAPAAAREFGVEEDNIFHLHEAVGGRFSLWSPVSLSAMAAMGAKAFEEFLHGGEEMDAHFQSAPLPQNLPVLLALIGVWNINVLGRGARAVLPYAEGLRQWIACLQQLEMESLGKSVDVSGEKLNYATSPVLFGSTGTAAQHAFMQALHQGTQTIPAEILLVEEDEGPLEARRFLQANALAQAEALAFGRKDQNAQKTVPGNRPCSVLKLKQLSPRTLGELVALYEHKVFVQGLLWHINPFDQWGVELGKQLAGPIEARLQETLS